MTESQPNENSLDSRKETGTTQPPPAAPAAADQEPAKAPPPAQPPAEAQVADAKKEAAANYDRYLRALADLENFRRRAIREKNELRQFGSAGLLQDLLPVVDNLQLAVNAARKESAAQSIADGVAMVLDQFRSALSRHGLKEVNPAGEKFDPHQHESLSHLPSAEIPEEHVAQVVRIGYKLHDRLLRPASVVLSSGPAKEAQP